VIPPIAPPDPVAAAAARIEARTKCAKLPDGLGELFQGFDKGELFNPLPKADAELAKHFGRTADAAEDMARLIALGQPLSAGLLVLCLLSAARDLRAARDAAAIEAST
jgi:hypothetical protein